MSEPYEPYAFAPLVHMLRLLFLASSGCARFVSYAPTRRHPRRGARHTAPVSARAPSLTCLPKDTVPWRGAPCLATRPPPLAVSKTLAEGAHTRCLATPARTGTCGRSRSFTNIALSRTAPSVSSTGRTLPSPLTSSSSLSCQR